MNKLITMLDKRKIYSIILFCLTLLAFYPGLMSTDSFHQYEQAINISFTDHHPPLMAIYWSFLTWFYQSPAVMLCFHLIMLWTSLYLLAKRYDSNYILLIGLLPFVINFAGVLWKDVGLGFSWLLAISIFISVKNKKYRRALFLIFIFYGVSIRPNAFLALIPILLYFYYSEYRLTYFNNIVVTLLTIIFFIFVNNIIVYKVFDAETLYAGPKIIMIHDLSGITKESHHNYFSQEINIKYDVSKIIIRYKPESVCSVLCGTGAKFKYKDFNKESLFKSWTEAVSDNPLLYLNLRWRNFKALTRIGYSENYYIFHNIDQKKFERIGIVFNDNILHKSIKKYVMMFNTSVFLSGWFWLIASFILLFFLKKNMLTFILGLSSILYISPYLIIGQASDFRYFYLSIFLVILGIITLLKNKTP